VKTLGWISFPRRLWQRNYYEHIIRDGASLDRIRRYIAGNPAHWPSDDENPQNARR
jgi:REP element-mobilizing transposase RayT